MERLDYNQEPVYYCTRCLSLKIRAIPKLKESEYCDNCGSTSIAQCSIFEWEKMYKERYGHSFLNTY